MSPGEHEGYRFDAAPGFVAHLGKGDVIALGLTLYFANIVALKLFRHPMLKGLLIVGALAVVYLLSQLLKRLLAPYPRVVRHFFDWYLGGVDAIEPAPDPEPVPLRARGGTAVQPLQRVHAHR